MAAMSLDELKELVQARRELPPPGVRRALREGAGITRAQIAATVGVTKAAVAFWEAGQRNPSREHVQAYLQVLEALK